MAVTAGPEAIGIIMKLLFEDCIEQREYQEVFLGTIFTVDSPNVVTLVG